MQSTAVQSYSIVPRAGTNSIQCQSRSWGGVSHPSTVSALPAPVSALPEPVSQPWGGVSRYRRQYRSWGGISRYQRQWRSFGVASVVTGASIAAGAASAVTSASGAALEWRQSLPAPALRRRRAAKRAVRRRVDVAERCRVGGAGCRLRIRLQLLRPRRDPGGEKI